MLNRVLSIELAQIFELMGQASSTTHSSDPRYYRFAEFELDALEETLSVDGSPLSLNRRTFQVLLLLLKRRGEVVAKQEFFEQIWAGSFVEDNNLTVAITALRKAIGDNPKQPRFIENLPRRGYRFIAPVTAVAENPTEDAASQEEEITSGSRSGRSRLIARIVAVCLLALIVIAGVGYTGLFPSAGSPASERITSVAVLPFQYQSDDSAYLADGLTEGVIKNLSGFPQLRVVDKNSANQYRNTEKDLAAIGRELNVRGIVTGKIERDGDVMIVTSELRDESNNVQVWKQQFRRRTSDIFAVQQEISKAIAQTLELAPADNVARRQSVDAEAFDLYLKGRYHLNKRTGPDFLKARDLFKAAIDRDPTFAKAYVGLADAYTLGAFPELSNEEKNAMIRSAIEKALEIDDTLGDAYAGLAINKCYYEWDFAGAEKDYRRAIELDPNNATAHHWYAEFLAMQGRFDESFAEYDRAQALDPLSLPIKTDMALSHYYAGDVDKAIAMLIRIKDVHPDYRQTYVFLEFAYSEKGLFNEATEMMERENSLRAVLGERKPALVEGYRAFIVKLRAIAKTDGAEGFWRAMLKTPGSIPPIYSAAIHAKAGDRNGAFAELERGIKLRDTGMVWIMVQPELEGLRSDPRYVDMLRRVGF